VPSDKFTVEEVRNYLTSCDSFGDALHYLSAEKILAANKPKLIPLTKELVKPGLEVWLHEDDTELPGHEIDFIHEGYEKVTVDSSYEGKKVFCIEELLIKS
jgi:hypothetical protein